MRAILAVSLIAVVLMSTPCWGRVLPQDQQGPPSASHPPRIADAEWAMIESACRNQRLSHGHAAYLSCLSRQVKALEASPGKPSLASESAEERATIEAACVNQRLSHGPAAYYNCLRQQLATPGAMPAKPSILAAQDKGQSIESAPDQHAPPKPHPSPPGLRPAQQASATSAQTAKQHAESASRDAAADQGNNSAPSAAATPALTAAQLEVLASIIVAAIAVWLLWKASRHFRGTQCTKCGKAFPGQGAYCPNCLAAAQEAARRAAAGQRHAEEQGRAWNRQTPRAEEEAHERRQRSQQSKSEPDSGFDPYLVLGVARNAGKEEIRAAYLRQMASYHPDKVAHLGEDLQQLAKRKAQAINRAYEELLQAT
jgi:hypothetical protein